MKSSRDPVYYCNGQYLPASEAKLSVSDLGVIRGFGLFESLRTYAGHPFLLEAHLKRLWKAVRFTHLQVPVTQDALAGIVRRLIRRNGSGDLLIRIILTGGWSSSIVPQKRGSVIVMVDPLHRFPAWQYQQGIALMTTHYARILPHIKTTVYFAAVMETARARRRGFEEVVYLDGQGALIEGTTFNVFAVLPGPRLVTPKEGVLAGITGDCVMRLARQAGLPVDRRPIRPSDLQRAREMFITSSNRELIPAIRVDARRIGNGRPGDLTRLLHSKYKALVAKEIGR